MEIPRICYSVREAAEAMGISEWLMREECRLNHIYSFKIGGRLLIPVWALENLAGKSKPLESEPEEDEPGVRSWKVNEET